MTISRDDALMSAAFHFTQGMDGATSMNPREFEKVMKLTKALQFIRDLANEELPHAPVGSGAEVALRHIVRKTTETLVEFAK